MDEKNNEENIPKSHLDESTSTLQTSEPPRFFKRKEKVENGKPNQVHKTLIPFERM
jgi:hypothetical protein